MTDKPAGPTDWKTEPLPAERATISCAVSEGKMPLNSRRSSTSEPMERPNRPAASFSAVRPVCQVYGDGGHLCRSRVGQRSREITIVARRGPRRRSPLRTQPAPTLWVQRAYQTIEMLAHPFYGFVEVLDLCTIGEFRLAPESQPRAALGGPFLPATQPYLRLLAVFQLQVGLQGANDLVIHPLGLLFTFSLRQIGAYRRLLRSRKALNERPQPPCPDPSTFTPM